MITYRFRRLRVIASLAFGLLLSACNSAAGGVTTATPIILPTPTPPIAPTYDVAAHATMTATPISFVAPTGGVLPPLPQTVAPCPTAIGATLVTAVTTSREPGTSTVLPPARGTPAPIATATPLVDCEGRTGPPTATALARQLTPFPPPPTHPGSPPTVLVPGGIPATFTPIPPPGSPGSGTIPFTATPPPRPPTPIPTATRVGVPPHRQFVSTVVDRTPGIPALPTPAATTAPDQPSYTDAEVRAYVLSNPPHGNKITTSAAPGYTVVAVMLTTIAQFDLQFGTGTQAPADTLVYVVELAGQFTMSGGPAPGTVNRYPSYVEVFDAHTGRLIIEGGFARY